MDENGRKFRAIFGARVSFSVTFEQSEECMLHEHGGQHINADNLWRSQPARLIVRSFVVNAR